MLGLPAMRPAAGARAPHLCAVCFEAARYQMVCGESTLGRCWKPEEELPAADCHLHVGVSVSAMGGHLAHLKRTCCDVTNPWKERLWRRDREWVFCATLDLRLPSRKHKAVT